MNLPAIALCRKYQTFPFEAICRQETSDRKSQRILKERSDANPKCSEVWYFDPNHVK